MDTFTLALNAATIVLVIVNSVALLIARKRFRRAGWIDGRIDLLQHMAQAQEEGLDFDTFIRQVAARDGYLLPEDRA